MGKGINMYKKYISYSTINIASTWESSDSTDRDYIFSFIQDDIEKILLKIGFYTYQFDQAYEISKQILVKTLQKYHLRGVSRFYSLSQDEALQWLISRLTNTIKSILTDKRNPNYIVYSSCTEDDLIDQRDTLHQVEVEIELSKFTRDQILAGLRAIWIETLDDVDFDWLDFVELCHKFHIDPDCITGVNNKAIVYEYGKFQLIFDFEMEGAA